MKKIVNLKDRYEELCDKVHHIMIDRKYRIQSGDESLYSIRVHEYIRKKDVAHARIPREIMLPMPEEKWYPVEKFNSLKKYYSKVGGFWPQNSHVQYAADYLTSEHFAFLFSGYALCEDKLLPCTFFAQLLSTQKVEGMDELIPEWWVIDPMALTLEKKPEAYIGIEIKREIVEKWFLSKVQDLHFLEAQIDFDDQYRLDIHNGTNRRIYQPKEEVKENAVEIPEVTILDFQKSTIAVNNKLKSIYFHWSKNYFGPPPRSLAVTFTEHLEFERYDFNEDWFKKVLTECGLTDKDEFDIQVSLIEELYKKFAEGQEKKRIKKQRKKMNIYYAKCEREGVLPF